MITSNHHHAFDNGGRRARARFAGGWTRSKHLVTSRRLDPRQIDALIRELDWLLNRPRLRTLPFDDEIASAAVAGRDGAGQQLRDELVEPRRHLGAQPRDARDTATQHVRRPESAALAPGTAGRPVNSSKAMQPTANRSVRASTARPSTCSGATKPGTPMLRSSRQRQVQLGRECVRHPQLSNTKLLRPPLRQLEAREQQHAMHEALLMCRRQRAEQLMNQRDGVIELHGAMANEAIE